VARHAAAGGVDGLGQVDDDRALCIDEDVVFGQIAVDERIGISTT